MSKGRNTAILGARVPDSVYARVNELAKKQGVTVNDWLKAVIIRAAGIRADGNIRSHH